MRYRMHEFYRRCNKKRTGFADRVEKAPLKPIHFGVMS